ncbi:MAG: hypothetical protein WDN69_34660 [Aliidongia sp.]
MPLDRAAELVGRALRREQHVAPGRIFAESDALGPAQHLDIGHVIDRFDQAAAGLWHLGEIGHDRRIGAEHATEAADGKIRLARTVQPVDIDLQRGDMLLQVIGGLHRVALQRLAAQRGDGDRHGFEVFREAPGGDDDLFDLSGLLFRGIRGRRLIGLRRRQQDSEDERRTEDEAAGNAASRHRRPAPDTAVLSSEVAA